LNLNSLGRKGGPTSSRRFHAAVDLNFRSVNKSRATIRCSGSYSSHNCDRCSGCTYVRKCSTVRGPLVTARYSGGYHSGSAIVLVVVATTEVPF